MEDCTAPMSLIDLAHSRGITDNAAIARCSSRYAKHTKQTDHPMTLEQFFESDQPTKDEILITSIVDNMVDPLPDAAERLARLSRSMNYVVRDTVAGYAISNADAEKIIAYLQTLVAIRPIWEEYCSKNDLPTDIAAYTAFLREVNTKNYKTLRYHPSTTDTEFLAGTPGEVCQVVAAINGTSEYLTLAAAAIYLDAPRQRIDKLFAASDKITVLAGVPFLAKANADQIKSEWAQYVEMNDYNWFSMQEEDQRQVRTRIADMFSDGILESLLLPEESYPWQNNRYAYIAASDLRRAEEILSTRYVIPITLAGITEEQLKKGIKCGKIPAENHRGQYYITPQQCDTYRTFSERYASIETIVEDLIRVTETDFDPRYKRNWDMLSRFCEDNSWWGIKHTKSDLFPRATQDYIDAKAVEDFSDHISFWLQTHGKSPEEEFALQLASHKERFPAAVLGLTRSFPDDASRTKAAAEMADELFFLLQKDIDKLSKREIEKLINNFRKNCSITAGNCLARFLSENGYFTGKIKYFSTAETTPDVTAYSMESFCTIAGTICCQDVWEDLSLVDKAVSNYQYAQLWLYVALHCFSTLRSTDYIRLQAPIMDEDPDEVLRMIRAKQYPAAKAQRWCVIFESLNSFLSIRPNKTSNYQNVAPIYFHVPSDCEVEMGTIISIALAHYTINERSGNYISSVSNKSQQLDFFGPIFVQACDDRAFSGRRANKALMQLITVTAQEKLHLSPDVAYSLASSLRSHKGGYAKLSETTYRYLNNSRFSTLNSDYIVKQMFLRGSCSFIADSIINKYYGLRCSPLPAHLQTQAIQSLGLTPYEASNLELATKRAMIHAEELVEEYIQSPNAAENALRSIVVGDAKGKDYYNDCLLRAIGKQCDRTSYQHCAGCPYEIRSKAQYVQFYTEYQRLTETIKTHEERIKKLIAQQRSDVTNRDKKKKKEEEIRSYKRQIQMFTHLRDSVVSPALQEIIVHLNHHCDDSVLQGVGRIKKRLED